MSSLLCFSFLYRSRQSHHFTTSPLHHSPLTTHHPPPTTKQNNHRQFCSLYQSTVYSNLVRPSVAYTPFTEIFVPILLSTPVIANYSPRSLIVINCRTYEAYRTVLFFGGVFFFVITERSNQVQYVSVGRELRTSPSGIGNSSYELPEDLQGCDEAALPLSHTKLLVRGGT